MGAETIVFQIAILIMSVVIHEVSHGFVALLLGDTTAKYAGRLTLNPLKHLDPFGSVLFPILLAIAHLPVFGWARPVPYNPYNLRNQKWGPGLVGAAGPLSNLFVAVVFGLLLRVIDSGALGDFITPQFIGAFAPIVLWIVLINIILAVFNLVPIPPLDGSKVLFSFLPYQYRSVQEFLETYGLILLVVFIFFFSQIIFPVAEFLFRIITGIPLSF